MPTQKNKWKEPAVPRTVVQMAPVDKNGMVLVMHRGPNVRSIPNVWSFPSGMHEIGERMEESLERELREEYDLQAIDCAMVGQYENIAGDLWDQEQYHWVISLYVALVEDVKKAVNKEPDKHDRMEFVHYTDLVTPAFWDAHRFHNSFHEEMREGRHRLALAAQTLVLKEVIE